ncbi:RAMP superfamily CRISPR-associated protein [Gammaproteobacteria bacterium AB-CW1]|uniref:RAMP superfamily CRISPR-associated protein n=1 Tax=Natronospira elongata TaxID=3110268 RepID=A0AAP6JFC8_9GAMM|nr:RAMP superfamily CRISPR-associated protein [Gammaproteobacteria bacterium AB-CW1]
MEKMILNLDIRHYWHPGAGEGMGAYADAAAWRASDGLPAIPGRQLKGLLRDAVAQAGDYGWCEPDMAARLFGRRTEEDKADQPATGPATGCLRVSDARLPEAERAWLAGPEGQGLRPHLFRTLYSTAIDGKTGTARDHSLRGIEVVVPMQLQAVIQTLPEQGAVPQDWQALIEQVLPLITAVGGWRSRGLGRVVLSLDADREAAA